MVLLAESGVWTQLSQLSGPNVFEKIDGEKWPWTMTLPCRRCTDVNKGEEVWKPLSAFFREPRSSRSLEGRFAEGPRLMLLEVHASIEMAVQ